MFLSNDFEVRDLGPVLARRRGIILVFILVFLALSIALNTITPPAYRTAARIAILPVASRSPVTGATARDGLARVREPHAAHDG
jgi:uncharacterized protein involved in exopolysaccharide biosynthesis